MRLSILNIFGFIKHTVFPVTEVNYFVKKQNVKKILMRDKNSDSKHMKFSAFENLLWHDLILRDLTEYLSLDSSIIANNFTESCDALK